MTSSDQNAFDAKTFLASLTHRPGTYRMLDARGKIIYVGKARDLKKRVSSYFQKSHTDAKTVSLMRHAAGVEVTVTNTESEALILEYNLIKRHRPRFNVVLRDDKSYPYIYASTEHAFPRLRFFRGARKGRGRYFGPYPNAGSVRKTLNELQKLFLLRNCTDGFFRNRTRPCLQHQIKRCTAPCVGLISSEEYAEDVAAAMLFLEGKNRSVIDALVTRMERAAANQEYEQAARYRDQITPPEEGRVRATHLAKLRQRFGCGRAGDRRQSPLRHGAVHPPGCGAGQPPPLSAGERKNRAGQVAGRVPVPVLPRSGGTWGGHCRNGLQ